MSHRNQLGMSQAIKKVSSDVPLRHFQCTELGQKALDGEQSRLRQQHLKEERGPADAAF